MIDHCYQQPSICTSVNIERCEISTYSPKNFPQTLAFLHCASQPLEHDNLHASSASGSKLPLCLAPHQPAAISPELLYVLRSHTMATSTNNPPLNPVMNTANPQAQNGTSFPDHKRAPSMTVTPAGATKYGAPQNTANIQFGSVNNGTNTATSPPSANPQGMHQPSNSLGLNNFTAHSNSPSPVPQPAQVSGGRPPSGVSTAPIAMNFGRLEGSPSDTNVRSTDFVLRGTTTDT